MNNQQKAEEYAASKTKDIGYQKELTEAVLYGYNLAVEFGLHNRYREGYRDGWGDCENDYRKCSQDAQKQERG